MWTADNWKDYEVLDTSEGEKLERWGDYLLIRPDPQVIWSTEKRHPGWKKWNGYYHRSSKGGGEWEFSHLPEQWSIRYGDLTFQLKPFSFKHTGLFPEQAVNWDWFSEKIRLAGRPVRVRNPVFPAALRDSARPPAHRPLGVHAVSSAGRPNSRELTAACNGDCPTHSRLSGNITSATASTETTAKIHFRFIATSFL